MQYLFLDVSKKVHLYAGGIFSYSLYRAKVHSLLSDTFSHSNLSKLCSSQLNSTQPSLTGYLNYMGSVTWIHSLWLIVL